MRNEYIKLTDNTMFEQLTMDIVAICLAIVFGIYTLCTPFAEIYILTVSNVTSLDTSSCFHVWDWLICSIISHFLILIVCCIVTVFLCKGISEDYTIYVYLSIVVVIGYSLAMGIWLMVPLVDGIINDDNDCPELKTNNRIYDIIIIEAFIFWVGVLVLCSYLVVGVLLRKTNILKKCCVKCDNCWKKTLSLDKINYATNHLDEINTDDLYRVDLDKSPVGNTVVQVEMINPNNSDEATV